MANLNNRLLVLPQTSTKQQYKEARRNNLIPKSTESVTSSVRGAKIEIDDDDDEDIMNAEDFSINKSEHSVHEAPNSELECEMLTEVQSYRRYAIFNGVRFLLLGGIILCIGITQQIRINGQFTNNADLCCFCYAMAASAYTSDPRNPTIFEWSVCEHVIGDDLQSIESTCFNGERVPWIDNLSVNYDIPGLDATKHYYLSSALIVFGIVALYSIGSIVRSFTIRSTVHLMRDCLLHLLYNCIISMMCFYQTLVIYQYYPHEYAWPAAHSAGIPTPPTESGTCYVNALQHLSEMIIDGILLSALLYIFVPCFVQCYLRCAGDHCFTKCVKKVAYALLFGCCGVGTVVFLAISMFYTYKVLDDHEQISTILVIIVDVGLALSYFDVLLFEIRRYAKVPFLKLLNCLCCCVCVCAYRKRKSAAISYIERFPSMTAN